MPLNRFSKFSEGTNTYLDLLNEIGHIYNIKDFYVVVKHRGDVYRIRGIYDTNLNKSKHPKKFRKSIFNAKPEALLKRENNYSTR